VPSAAGIRVIDKVEVDVCAVVEVDVIVAAEIFKGVGVGVAVIIGEGVLEDACILVVVGDGVSDANRAAMPGIFSLPSQKIPVLIPTQHMQMIVNPKQPTTILGQMSALD